jgi:hypothetical protein
MTIIERQQDLFSLDYQEEYSLCHCVSGDLAMGKGIAVLFRDKFGRVDDLRKQNPAVGGACSLPSGKMRIYYLITKPKYWNKPTYDSMRASLLALKVDMTQRGYKRIAMPKIGCGLDGLDWSVVKGIIADVFAESGIDVLVCIK